jgi:hypothetical protein
MVSTARVEEDERRNREIMIIVLRKLRFNLFEVEPLFGRWLGSVLFMV